MFLKAGLSKRTPLGLFLALLFSAVLLGSLLQGFVNAPKAFAATCDRANATQLINCSGTGSDYWNNGDTGTTTGTTIDDPGCKVNCGGVPHEKWGLIDCSVWTANPNAQTGYQTSYYPVDQSAGTCAVAGMICPPQNNIAAYGAEVHYTNTSKTTIKWRLDPGTATCVYPYHAVTATVTPIGGGNGRCLVSITEDLYYGGTSSSTIVNGKGAHVAGPESKSTGFKVSGLPGNCENGDKTQLKWSPDLPTASTLSNALCQQAKDGSSCRGYYSIKQVNRYRDCIAKTYPAWTKHPVDYSCKAAYNLTVAPEYYTNSCKNGVTKGLDYNADFDPAACNTKWSCNIQDTTVNGQNAKTAVTAIRNGSPLTVKIPSVQFSGTGVDKTSVDNVKSVSKVVAGSTPYNTNSSSVNDKTQFFYLSKLKSDPAGSGQINFNSKADVPYSATSVKKATDYLFFYWASDPKGAWQMRTTYTFDAYFYNANSSTLNGATAIKRELQVGADCTDHGDTYSMSPRVTVVRSTTHE